MKFFGPLRIQNTYSELYPYIEDIFLVFYEFEMESLPYYFMTLPRSFLIAFLTGGTA